CRVHDRRATGNHVRHMFVVVIEVSPRGCPVAHLQAPGIGFIALLTRRKHGISCGPLCGTAAPDLYLDTHYGAPPSIPSSSATTALHISSGIVPSVSSLGSNQTAPIGALCGADVLIKTVAKPSGPRGPSGPSGPVA